MKRINNNFNKLLQSGYVEVTDYCLHTGLPNVEREMDEVKLLENAIKACAKVALEADSDSHDAILKHFGMLNSEQAFS